MFYFYVFPFPSGFFAFSKFFFFFDIKSMLRGLLHKSGCVYGLNRILLADKTVQNNHSAATEILVNKNYLPRAEKHPQTMKEPL